MRAEISLCQLWMNPSIINFFFRKQSREAVEELMSRASNKIDAIDAVEHYAYINDMDVEAIEEMFHDMSFEELVEAFNIDVVEE